MQAGRSRDTKNSYEETGEEPSRFDVWGWYLYEFCSYFVQTVLIPLVFPLIISQLQHLPFDPIQDWNNNHPAMSCAGKQILLYSKVTKGSIAVGGLKFSSLEWASIAWGGGLAIAAPILAFISLVIDDGQFQTIITIAATGVGVFFCLPAGFFKTTKIFIPYIAAIAVASTVATTSHTHHLGLMIGPNKTQFGVSRTIRFSIYSTAAGCLGSAIISSFTYHMLREPNERDFISLWVVSIFSGFLWLVGVVHAFTAENKTTSVPSISFSSPRFHLFSVFRYPHAIGGLIGVLLSSFATMCVFTGGVLFIVGQLCVKPVHLLYLWLTYFLFPMVSLPLLLQPFQQLIKANSVKMKILGFMLTLITCGFGFYFWDSEWKLEHLLIFGAIQGTASGVLHAFGRVLVLDCAPYGKEGAFCVWYGWVRAVGLCVGFTVGSVVPGEIRTCFGAAFCGAIVGIVVLLFGNVSEFDGGAVDAGRVSETARHDHHLDPKESFSL
ncbi:hypothetical protein RJT34_31143 [Clitoria ternatea]|uniref:Uncharacterized protein n=1 Tax=Clitoria ternatea TaxID=43366 RepID=A0AAN9EVX8_CLITE